jgi:hypothetical protein
VDGRPGQCRRASAAEASTGRHPAARPRRCSRAATSASVGVAGRCGRASAAGQSLTLGTRPDAHTSINGPAPGAKTTALASLDELIVWGHDLEVVPGRTYQYRCVARVYNPFFGTCLTACDDVQ